MQCEACTAVAKACLAKVVASGFVCGQWMWIRVCYTWPINL